MQGPSICFDCTSGTLLWGEICNIGRGVNNEEVAPNEFDGVRVKVDAALGGTILQRERKFRTRAKKVEIKEKLFSSSFFHQGKWFVRGYNVGDRLGGIVADGEGVDPLDSLVRASRVGISNSADHDDQEVLYIGRYDHGWHSKAAEDFRLLGKNADEVFDEFCSGNLILLDGAAGRSFLTRIGEDVAAFTVGVIKGLGICLDLFFSSLFFIYPSQRGTRPLE